MFSDNLKVCSKQKANGYLLIIDNEENFNSLNHNFLKKVLVKFGLKTNFITWMKILLINQVSCIVNGDNTTEIFHLEKDTCQGNPISAYFFIISLEALFISIKNNSNSKGIFIVDCFFSQ